MADPKLHNKDILPRVNSLKEAGLEPLQASNIAKLNERRATILKEIGLDLGEGEEWTLPRTESSYVPRLFILGKNKNNHDIMTTPKSLNIKPGSPEFWEQVQMGNVFVYPAGKKDPVQLQAEVNRDGTSHIGFSKPITPENMPANPARPVNIFKRFLNLVTAGRAFKNEIEAWKNRDQDTANVISKLKECAAEREHRVVSTDGTKSKEEQQADLKIAEVLEREDLKRKQDALEKVRYHRDHNEYHKGIMTSIFRPDPEFRDEEHIFKGPNATQGLYTKEQFDALKKYSKEEIDIDKINVGKEKLKADEFAAVTMFALWDDDIALKSIGIDKGSQASAPDIHAVSSLKSVGIEEKDTKRILASTVRSMYTGDLFMKGLRDSEGAYFKDITNLGREKAVKAFQDYKKGDNTALSKIIADGINKSAENILLIDGTIGSQDQACFVMSEKLLDLMEKDPTLKDKALANGMDPDKLKTVEGMKVMNHLEKESREAEYKLTEAAVNGKELSAKEKADCAKAIYKSKIALMQLNVDNAKNYEVPEVMEKQAVLATNMQKANAFKIMEWSKDPSKRPAPEPGKVWSDTAGSAILTLRSIYGKLPQSVMDLTAPNAEKKLDALADKIVKQEGIANKSTEWLSNELNHEQSNPEIDLTKACEKAINNATAPKQEVINEAPAKEIVKDAPEVNAEQNKQSIKDRAKMFEPVNGIIKS